MNFILELLTLNLAVVCGLLFFRRLTLFYRILLLQCIVYLTIEIYVYFVNGQNHWLYNVSIAIEMGLLLLAVYAGIKKTNAKYKYILIASTVLFYAVLCLDVFYLKNSFEFAHHAAIVQGILLTILYLWLLYLKIIDSKTRQFNWALFFACAGLILYYACSIPYLSVLFYLQKENPDLNLELFEWTISILSHLRYLFMGIAFLLEWLNTSKNKHVET